MADFDQLRLQLQQSRGAASTARNEAAAAREKLERLNDRKRAMDRSFDPQNGAHVQARSQLEQAIQAATADLTQKQNALTGSLAAEIDSLGQFGDLVLDPRQLIGQWQDDKPILMFPVRLETRFKSVNGQAQLWVRVYPDDISIDTFEETLSENEVKNAQLYWSGIWAAGGQEGERREAWRGLVGSHGSGRAEYIIRNYLPLTAPEPVKDPGDVLLVFATEAPLPDAERDKLLEFWPALHAAGEDATAIAAARDLLVNPFGEARADELIEQYKPFNFASQPAEGGVVGAEYLLFPKSEDLGVKRRAWSRAATASLLPDRFVFIGYNGGAEQVFSIGKPVLSPLECSPDPTLPETEQLHQDPITGELFVPEPLQWMSDFDRAVDAGMGFRIDLTSAQAQGGFDRVLVVGLRLSSDATEAKQELETLFEHHRNSRAGLQIVPQGTPTNNTEANSAGFSMTEDADESYDDLAKTSLFAHTENWLDKQDGQWLAEYLGIEEAATAKIRNAGGRDQADARAMNAALWPATLGYWMDSMMETVFNDAAIRRTQDFFSAYVSGRGAIPALRVGRQPYGIVPATTFSRMTWVNPQASGIDGAPELHYLGGLNAVLQVLDQDWRKFTEDSVAYAGRPGDPHDILLDIVGLHPASVHLTQRYAESLEQLRKRLSLEGLSAFFDALLAHIQSTEALALLKKFAPFRAPEILEKFFLRDHHDLKGPVVDVDNRPLSEVDSIQKSTADGTKNYLEWLLDAGRTSLDAVYAQKGFKDDKPPRALLYLMLRHAMQLAFHDASVRLLLQPAQVRAAKRDDPFVHIRAQAQQSESKYALLYRNESFNGSPPVRVGDHIAQSVLTIVEAHSLREQLEALERLKHASTARLERAFIEHIDTCTYRLDSWILGIVHAQLARMRRLPDVRNSNTPPTPAKKGVYVGAYAWLEALRPDNRVLVPHTIQDPKVAQDFAEAGAPPLVRDSLNQGYIHAPSLNHAVAAAVLRNGYVSNASAANRQTMAVNLTSERVRTALGMLEGIRGGQSLGALLGYQFERGLHDGHDFGVELDEFIFDLRREFPLRSNRLKSTKVDDDDLAIESIEARNVLDGLALMEHIRKTGNGTYPFGIGRLPAASPARIAAITAEADRMLESYDAVADLALAEGVYQAVIGNYDRVASTLDAYSKGNFPSEPQIVRTPFDGTGLTHRVALHLAAGADPNVSPIAGVDPTPRSLAEPAVNQWLASVLPPFDQIGVAIEFHEAASNGLALHNTTLAELGIQPLDLLVLLRDDRDRISLTELDERLTRLVAGVARPDKPVDIRYRDSGGAPFSIFEVMPLVRHLRRLLRKARPLRATDMELPNEAKRGDDAQESVDRNRIQLTLDELNGAIGDLDTLRIALADPPLANADAWIGMAADALSRAALFAIPQSGWAFAFEFRAGIFRSVLKKAAEDVTRWNDRLTKYDAVMADYDALAGGTDQERFTLLAKAALHIHSTSVVPATPAAFRTQLDLERAVAEGRRDALAALPNTTHTTLTGFLGHVSLFVNDELTLGDEEAAHARFAEDALQTVNVVMAEAQRRKVAAEALLQADTDAVTAAAHVKALTAAAKVLLGDDFTIVPQLTLGATQREELASAFGASGSLLDYVVNVVKTPLPVDTWLYGVARVREPLRDLEQITMLAGAFGRTEPELTPLQLPFTANDLWMALELPHDDPNFKLEGERLLYTAHFPTPFDKTRPQCGLLVDEWTEVIPAKQTTTGVAVHYDRPNNEAPNALLLVTPPEFLGKWQWQDLVDALHETLDFAKRRAVEPVHFEATAYAHLLPATLMAVTVHQLTISANLSINNNVAQWMQTP